MSNPIQSMMDNSVEKIKAMADANTVMGQPVITADGTTVIPISRIKVGFAGGGSEFTTKNSAPDSKPYGGGSGATISITPVAFLILKDGSSRILPIPESGYSSVDRAIEMIPELVDKAKAFFDVRKAGKE